MFENILRGPQAERISKVDEIPTPLFYRRNERVQVTSAKIWDLSLRISRHHNSKIVTLCEMR